MANKITGRVQVVVNGKTMLNKEGATANGIGISGEPSFEVNPVMGDTGIHGYVETPIAPSIEVTLTDREDISLSELAQILEDGTVIYKAARGGKAYVLEEATCKRNFTITAGEGEVPVTFFGLYWTETTQ